jgi:hypothetical protein
MITELQKRAVNSVEMMKDMADEASAVAATSSPKNRVKLLCSYGGKIMPRAVDGHLKYVGGETRVIAIPRDINFTGFLLFFYARNYFLKQMIFYWCAYKKINIKKKLK